MGTFPKFVNNLEMLHVHQGMTHENYTMSHTFVVEIKYHWESTLVVKINNNIIEKINSVFVQ